MLLETIELPHPPTIELPDRVSAFLADAETRRDEFYADGLGPRYYRYVPSDPLVVFHALAFLLKSEFLRDREFCELGCGFAIAAGMASLIGYRACGLEIEDPLAARAETLMQSWQLDVPIYRESYLPEGFESCEGYGGKDLIVPPDHLRSDYENFEAHRIDLFFVYPWPDEEAFMRQLFAAIADEGSVLLMYRGEGEISAYLLDEK